MEAPVQPVAKPDLPLDVRPDVSAVDAADGNDQKTYQASAMPAMPAMSDALLDLDDFKTAAPVAVSEDLILDLDEEDAGSEAAVVVTPEMVSEPALAFETAWPVEPVAAEQPVVSSPHEESQAAEFQEWAIVTQSPSVARPQEPALGAPPQEASDTRTEFSPADVDAIARRVVEQLSEKVVREIAWEVVPELAELLIKQKLEEKK